jgi:hypothetical protein
MSKTILYTPAPPDVTGLFSSPLLKHDREAWNLAWMSRPCGLYPGEQPDPNFTSLVFQTVQFVPATGEIALAGQVPDCRLVRSLMGLPPPAVLKRIVELDLHMQMPLYEAYGHAWIDTMSYWARWYRVPEHPVLDRPIHQLGQAQQALAHF